ncbi:hypothetical protein WMY93_016323 [Mugilogobius chulae]|uniref:Uncharacterized protein n=1 Tax=Mugilogobius chulae TaxID=88201 RepID=A0AAW0P2T2_9GOBI
MEYLGTHWVHESPGGFNGFTKDLRDSLESWRTWGTRYRFMQVLGDSLGSLKSLGLVGFKEEMETHLVHESPGGHTMEDLGTRWVHRGLGGLAGFMKVLGDSLGSWRTWGTCYRFMQVLGGLTGFIKVLGDSLGLRRKWRLTWFMKVLGDTLWRT